MKAGRIRAFTLVELLVVGGIIVILGAILLGVLMNARGNSRYKQCAALLQTLITAVETMKTDYGYTRPLGVDASGNILPDARLDAIDIGKELDPRSPLWNPLPDKDTEIILNKRLKTYYEVHSSQVKANSFVDPFGNRIFYHADEINQDVDNDGTMERYVEERLESPGPNGLRGDDDDVVQVFPRRALMGK